MTDYDQHIRTLNRLVFAAEALDTPKLPEIPPELDWEKSPTGVESSEAEALDLAGMTALALEWQEWANKLDDILREVSIEDFANELAAVRAKAKEARLSLIAIEAYDPPVPGSP